MTNAENMYGESDWASKDKKDKKDTKTLFTKEEWLQLEDGENLIRVFTKPYTYYQHTLPGLAVDPKKQPRVKCSDPEGYFISFLKEKKISLSDVKCPICRMGVGLEEIKDGKVDNSRAYKAGYIPKKRWYIGVLNRTKNQAKVFEIGPQIQGQIKTYTEKQIYGDTIKYDLSITVNKGAAANAYYTIMPMPPEKLSADDLKIIEEFKDGPRGKGLEKIAALCKPTTEEQTQKRFAFLKDIWEKAQKPKDQKKESAASVPATSGTPPQDDDFPEEN